VSVIARLSPELKATGRFEEVRVAKARDPFPSSSRRFLVVPAGKEVQVVGRELNPLERNYAASKGTAARYAMGVPKELASKVASQLKGVFAGKQVRVLSAEAVERAVREGRLNPESHSKTELGKLVHNERLTPSLSGAQRQKLSTEINAIHSAEAAIAYAYSAQPGHKREIEQKIARQLKSHVPPKGQEVNAASLVRMVKSAATRVEGESETRPYGARAYGVGAYGVAREKQERGEKRGGKEIGGEYLKLMEKEAGKSREGEKGRPHGGGEAGPSKEVPEKAEKEEKPAERPFGKAKGGAGGSGSTKEEQQRKKEVRQKGLSWISPKGLWSSPSNARWYIIAAIVVFIIFLLMTLFS